MPVGGAAPHPVRGRSRVGAVRDGIAAATGTALGIAPHLLHHVGLLAGTALLTGSIGNLLFFVLGLAFSVPLLRRIHRRFGTWLAPAIALLVFAVLFAVSAFVIGPAISADPAAPEPVPAPSSSTPHPSHHP